MVKIAIIYYSGYGHTERVAEAIMEGCVFIENTYVKLFTPEEAINQLDTLDSFDAMIFGSPTYMGAIAAPFKAFMDATNDKWANRSWRNKIAAGFTNGGGLSGEKLNTLFQLCIFAVMQGMVWIGQGELPGQKINRLSSALGLMTQSGIDVSDMSMHEGDLETAKLFGTRVAQATLKWMHQETSINPNSLEGAQFESQPSLHSGN
jgi:NAD(P)H dehydrogenase (quinone)